LPGRANWRQFAGTALLLATVVGSGIMGERLCGGNVAVALLANTLATGAVLYALPTHFPESARSMHRDSLARNSSVRPWLSCSTAG